MRAQEDPGVVRWVLVDHSPALVAARWLMAAQCKRSVAASGGLVLPHAGCCRAGRWTDGATDGPAGPLRAGWLAMPTQTRALAAHLFGQGRRHLAAPQNREGGGQCGASPSPRLRPPSLADVRAAMRPPCTAARWWRHGLCRTAQRRSTAVNTAASTAVQPPAQASTGGAIKAIVVDALRPRSLAVE